ncbi:MAG: alanine racemase [Steroidobacteraceae bacterium]|nr:alanine racemase [Steroidobacteraceae bacterium]
MDFPSVTIDLAALRNNLGVVRRLAPDSRLLAAVKADGYGHGLIESARALSDADAFGVARIGEALALREAGVAHPILLLEGVFSAQDLAEAAAFHLDVAVCSFEQVAMLESFAAPRSLAVWLKIDTGMNRLGISPDRFVDAHSRVSRSPAVRTLRVMTHLACAERLDDPFTSRQLAAFDEATRSLGLERSIANSAGVIGWPQARLEWVRPGIMLYGVSPMPHTSAAELGLRPAMTLRTRVIAVRALREGDSVGYGCAWRAQRKSRVAIAAIGYGDGYPRTMPNGGPVLVGGREASIAGRVSMDLTAIDVTDLPDVAVGEEVVLFGAGLPVERVAASVGTIGYELLCRVTPRVRREVIGAAS